jgi:hypothetical protein
LRCQGTVNEIGAKTRAESGMQTLEIALHADRRLNDARAGCYVITTVCRCADVKGTINLRQVDAPRPL